MVQLKKDIWDEVDALPSGERTWFLEGVHRILIESMSQEKNSNGTPYIKVNAIDESDPAIKGSAMMYTSEKALPYTLRTLQGILAHNVKNDLEEEKVRAYFHKLADTDDLDLKKFDSKQAWFKKEKNGKTYINKDGEERDSYDTGIFSYEPKMSKPADVVIEDIEDSKIDLAEIPFD